MLTILRRLRANETELRLQCLTHAVGFDDVDRELTERAYAEAERAQSRALRLTYRIAAIGDADGDPVDLDGALCGIGRRAALRAERDLRRNMVGILRGGVARAARLRDHATEALLRDMLAAHLGAVAALDARLLALEVAEPFVGQARIWS